MEESYHSSYVFACASPQAELAATMALAKDFTKSGGQGEQLQAILVKRAEEHTNWVRALIFAVVVCSGNE